MTVPADGRIYANRFVGKCGECGVAVPVLDGAVIKDPSIAGGQRWITYHVEHLPAPYEKTDIAGAVATGAPRVNPSRWHGRHDSNPEHLRCASCSHWKADHVNIPGNVYACTGRFVGAPGGQCQCYGFKDPAHNAPVVVAAPVSPTTFLQQYMNTPVPTTPPPVPPTIVVFYGNIKSASDGQTHFIYPDEVARLHGIGPDIKMLTNVVIISPEQKATWQSRVRDPNDVFIVGPHYKYEEYGEAEQALRQWLKQKGIDA